LTNWLRMNVDDLMKSMGMGAAPSVDMEREFNLFWIAVLAAKPAIRDREQVTLTKDNLRKAMRTAYMAGAAKAKT
jgi:hypothetical protein